MEHGEIDPAEIGDKSVIGEWRFIPERRAETLLNRDMKLLFPRW